MGGVPCEIIIIGNQMLGNVSGIYESFTYRYQVSLTTEEKKDLTAFLLQTRNKTEGWLMAIREASEQDIKLITNGAQLVGNLNALCESVNESKLPEASQRELVAYLDEQNKKAEAWLKLMRERAEKEEY